LIVSLKLFNPVHTSSLIRIRAERGSQLLVVRRNSQQLVVNLLCVEKDAAGWASGFGKER
jgi:hypothetical protein